ncbi:alpha/beta hydrolase [Chloroflexota bacterium]
MMFLKKWWLRIGLALVAVVVIAVLGISVFLGHSMITPERKPVEGTPADLALAYEIISFPSQEDEIILRGWYLPVEDSEQVIIIVHGGDGNRADPSIGLLDIASGLVEGGYNVLMFDLRGHGESDGDRMSAGYYETRDLAGAVGYAGKQGFESIGVMGFSMGAATTLMAAAENYEIDALVADSSYADLQDMMKPEFSKRTRFPASFLPPLLFMVKLMYGVDFTAVSPVEAVPDIDPRPVFFIHGKLDDTVPVEHAHRLYEASGSPESQLWVVPESGHVRAHITRPAEYMNR